MDFEKRNNIYRIIMLIVVTAIITFLITSIGVLHYYEKTGVGVEKLLTTNENLGYEEKIKYIREYLDQHYFGEFPEEDKLEESAIKGYVEGIGDPYTEYLSKTEYEDLMINVKGSYVGIGVYIAQDKSGNVIIVTPIEDSPAEEAGLQSGDIISKVNGEDCTGMNPSLVASKVKGEEGTTVELEILRNGENFKKTIERKNIKIAKIKTKVLENNIGYIQIISFDENCAQEFKEKLEELVKQNIKSLIIDVRDNGGGLVSEAINIADLFIPKDNKIMIEVGKNKDETVIKSKGNVQNYSLKVTILANENSASASEILVGAFKENEVATIIGETTYGKGVMQEVFPLASGGALKVTIKEFRTPNGNVINKKGIEPTIKVESDLKTEKDEQLQKAIEECKK